MRGGAAAPTDIKEEATLVTKPQQAMTQTHPTTLGGYNNYEGQGKIPSSRTGGGHRGTTMRFGNDEIKPNDMKEDAKLKEDKAVVADTAADINYDNACRLEK